MGAPWAPWGPHGPLGAPMGPWGPQGSPNILPGQDALVPYFLANILANILAPWSAHGAPMGRPWGAHGAPWGPMGAHGGPWGPMGPQGAQTSCLGRMFGLWQDADILPEANILP